MTEKPSRGEARNLKLRRVAADLFLKRGYDGVSIDKIVELAGGSKSTVYKEFGGKCGLFIQSIEQLSREANAPLSRIDYTGLDLAQSLRKIAFEILKQVTSKRAIALHRLAVGESLHCPEVGEAWYTHGPARTAAYIRDVLSCHAAEIDAGADGLDSISVTLYNALTGDVLARLLTCKTRREGDAELKRAAESIVDLTLAGITSRTPARRRA